MLFAITETAFAIFFAFATGYSFLLLLMIMGIWFLGFVVVSLCAKNSEIDKQGGKPEKQYKIELDKGKNINITEENDLEKGE